MNTALVDLSNVCCAGGGGATWERYVRLRTVLRDQGLRVRAIGDNSLRHRLDAPDRTALEAHVRCGEVELVPYADPHLIRRAFADEGAVIVTNDRFRALRPQYPELDGFERVWSFRFGEDRTVLYRSPLERLGSAEVSAAVERETLEQHGYRTPADLGLLRWDWRCTTSGCALCGPVLEAVPFCDRGVAVCPSCDVEVDQLASTVGGLEVKLIVDEQVRQRITIASGQVAVLGRGRGDEVIDVSHLVEQEAVARISRAHLQLVNKDGRLRVSDVGSRNGSVVRRDDGSEVELTAGRILVLSTTDLVVLAGVLQMQVSGRRYPRAAALRYGVDAGLDPPPVAATELGAIR